MRGRPPSTAPIRGHPHTWNVDVAPSRLWNSSENSSFPVTRCCQGVKLGCPRRCCTSWEASFVGNGNGPGRTSFSTDFRHKKSKEVHNVCKPWVEQRPASWDEEAEGRIRLTACTPISTSPYEASSSTIAGGYQGDVTVDTCSKLCKKGQLSEAVAALGLLVQSKPRVSTSLFYSVLRGCLAQKNLVLGRRVHALAVKGGYQSNPFLANNILRMYASHGNLQEARQVFAQVSVPSTHMWFSIISAHADHGEAVQAVQLYKQMRLSNVKPNSYVFVAVLKACAISADLESGRDVHSELLKRGIVPDIFLGSSLVDMYAKCGSLDDARRVFNSLPTRNVVTWNGLINGYAEHGLGQEALALYARMEEEGIIIANRSTYASLLKACASIGALNQGKHLHSKILEKGLGADLVIATCMLNMYAKCGSLADARSVFDNLPGKNVMIWTTMMASYAEDGQGQEALALYAKMEQEGRIVADTSAFACLLKACATIGAVQQGKQLHSQILERGLETDVVLGSCLVDMYAKCGRLEEARRVFDSLPEKNVITWTAMVHAFGQRNEGHQAIQCFQEMLREGVQPNETTFVCLLGACSHEGLVNEGWQYFHAMVEDHMIVPTQKHYLCMVDLLGRSGQIHEAQQVLLSMPFERDFVGWMSLLNACRSHSDVECGRLCFESLIRLDPQHSAAYVLMANLYADVGRWTDVHAIESLRRFVGASKKPAKAGIEVNRQVHTFVVGEERDDISCKSLSMNVRLKEGGHSPHVELVLKPVSEKEKEEELCGHAEKLALAYGLLNTPEGTPLLVTKNLRMCGDCHSATQIMSKIEKREITVRDARCVHRFVEGSCSCGDRP